MLQAVTRVKLEQASKVKLWMPTRLLTGEGSTDREGVDNRTCSIRRGNERSMPEKVIWVIAGYPGVVKIAPSTSSIG